MSSVPLSSDMEASLRIVTAVQKVRRQKQRPTAERIRHMIERDGDSLSGTEVDQLLNLAVSSGAVERIYNTSGIVSYKEVVNNLAVFIPSVQVSKSSVDATPDTHKAESKLKPKTSESPAKESKKVEKKPKDKKLADKKLVDKKPADKKPSEKKPSEKKPSEKKLVDKKPSSRHVHASSVCLDTVSPDCKPTVVVDKHTDLSDVVLQVILRLGCASGKTLEKDIRSHYRLDIYPGVDIRRHIRTACKSLVRQDQLCQEGNNFVLMGDNDDADDVTLTVDKPTRRSADKSVDPQVVYFINLPKISLRLPLAFFGRKLLVCISLTIVPSLDRKLLYLVTFLFTSPSIFFIENGSALFPLPVVIRGD